jgi:hypothetical protein
MKTEPKYSADSPIIRRFLEVWHENGRREFEKSYPSLNYDGEYYSKKAIDRKKFIALDRGGSGGVFLVDRNTGEVYSIKGYGVPNRKLGRIERMVEYYELLNRENLELTGVGYVYTDRAIWTACGDLDLNK